MRSDEVKAVTARDVSRRTTRILDDVSQNGCSYLVIRYGQPVATIQPLHVPVTRPSWVPKEEPNPDVELSPLQEELLLILDRKMVPDEMLARLREQVRQGEWALAMTYLQAKRLVQRMSGGYVRSRLGDRVAAARKPPGPPGPKEPRG